MGVMLLKLLEGALLASFGESVPVKALRVGFAIIQSYLESGKPLDEGARLKLLEELDTAIREVKQEEV